MDELELKRYCCRRMVMTHVDLIEKLLKCVYYMRVDMLVGRGLTVHRYNSAERAVNKENRRKM
jgi:DNA-directed RNA polymerase I, II, and III subunit RPABC5